jgi:hypothetical protein
MKFEDVNNNIDSKEEYMLKVLKGEVQPEDRISKQGLIAFQIYKKIKDPEFKPESPEGLGPAMELYTDPEQNNGKSFSEIFHDIEDDPEFIGNERLKGDFLNITVDDVLIYAKEGRLLDSEEDQEQHKIAA